MFSVSHYDARNLKQFPRLAQRLIALVSLWCVFSCSITLGAQATTSESATPADASQKELADTKSYLSLVVKLRADNRVPQVVKATEVPGHLVTVPVPSRTVYEITKGGKEFMIGFLAEDPLGGRAFRGSDVGESRGQNQSATISLNIPATDLRSVRDGGVGVRMYELDAGSLQNGVGGADLDKLVKDGKAILRFELSPNDFAGQVRLLKTH